MCSTFLCIGPWAGLKTVTSIWASSKCSLPKGGGRGSYGGGWGLAKLQMCRAPMRYIGKLFAKCCNKCSNKSLDAIFLHETIFDKYYFTIFIRIKYFLFTSERAG